MSETLRDLVVSLSLQTDNFTRNIRSVNKQIAEAESKFKLAAAGVERVRTVHPVTDLDARCRAMLEMLKAQAVELGRAPLRSEVDETLRGTLVNRCGSWRNVLYQIGLEPVVHISPFSGAALDRSPGRTRPHSTALYDCYYRLLSPGPDTRRNLTLVEELARSLPRV